MYTMYNAIYAIYILISILLMCTYLYAMFNIMLNIMYQGYTEFSSCGSKRDRDGT